jgi:cysteine-rich repeat protein
VLAALSLTALALAACEIAEDTTQWRSCTADLVCPVDTECSLDGKRCLFCGDGTLNGSEICDDDNQLSGDGCDSNCTPTGCGNYIVTEGEACDDGNRLAGDLCDADCSRITCPETGCPD